MALAPVVFRRLPATAFATALSKEYRDPTPRTFIEAPAPLALASFVEVAKTSLDNSGCRASRAAS
ncbi:hypothetical protein GR247_15645 [Rhizobium leguminosarum]|uniref:hypothetical protein n=1 Tax=Rhizobium TaxID=379 RepID=UPI001030E310|nr:MULTISPECIES: hypothetical protein [Rhizobium]MCJ9691123.1 hypothetical protein [Rhizobium sp. PRIMUS64]NEJ21600.1 hypothetical protein [Rhizobium leguminosarum]TAY38569.1 hypothetical protein ELH89_16295 [Rhizobium leguminosarum]